MKKLMLLFFLTRLMPIDAQSKLILLVDSNEIPLVSKYQIKTNFIFSASVVGDLISIKNKLTKNGYLFASIDSLGFEKNVYYYKLYFGKRVESIVIKHDEKWVKLAELKDIEQYTEKVLKKYNDSGYYLAELKVDSLRWQNNQYFCNLSSTKNKKFTVDSIYFESEAKELNLPFVKSILQWNSNSIKKSSLSELEQKISQVNFIELIESPFIKLVDSSAILVFRVRERKLNQFNAFLGILPNGYNSGNISITGDVTLSLNNIMKRGIEATLNWQKPQSTSQFLFTTLSVPYVMNTPMGVNAAFSIEKFDTTYLRVIYELGLNYRMSYNHSVSFFYKNQSSTALNVDSSYKLTNKLPSVLDYSYQQVGIQYKYSLLDRILFPRDGIIVNLTTSFGVKNIHKNINITSALDAQGNSYERLYDSIKTTLPVLYLALNVEKYVLLSKRISIKTTLNSKMLISNNISTNEMYSFGGIRKPRGFDDNVFLSPYYATWSNEFHYYFTSTFFSNIFCDITNMKNTLVTQFSTKTPIGVGAGISLKTRGGIATVSLAFGNLDQQSIEFKNGKIHFGYVSTF